MDDKKKLIVLGALGVVMLGVGVFQFVSGGSPAPEPAAKKEDGPTVAVKAAEGGASTKTAEAEAEGGTEELELGMDPNLLAMASFPARDPFDGSRYAQTADAPKPIEQPQQPLKAPRTYTPPREINRGGTPGGFVPMDPTGMGLPVPGGGSGPTQKLPDIRDFNYTVSGVITGDRPAAVFTDDAGNQRLITVGGAIDGDSKLVSVSRGRVVVRHRGKTKTFTVGGNPQEKTVEKQ